MRRISAAVAAVVLAASLAGCGSVQSDGLQAQPQPKVDAVVAVAFPPSEIGDFSRLPDRLAYITWELAGANTMSTDIPQPHSPEEYVEGLKAFQESWFTRHTGLSTGVIQDVNLYTYGKMTSPDVPPAPLGDDPYYNPSGLLDVYVFTLKPDFVMDTAQVMDSAQMEFSASDVSEAGENWIRESNERYFAAGKHSVVIGHYSGPSTPQDGDAQMIAQLSEAISSSNFLDK